MRTSPIIAVIVLSSILPACGGSDSSATKPDSTDPSNEKVAASTGTPAGVDIWTPAAVGNTSALKSALDQVPDVNALDPDFQGTALGYAADFGQVATVKLLLDAGADPNARSGNGSTAAIGAVFFGRPECLRMLLDAGADPDLADENGITAFTALSIPWEMTKEFADLMEMPLSQAGLESGREECWRLLGPRVDIWAAAATGETTALRARLAEGVDVDAPDPIGAATPLAIAANFGQVEAIRILLEAGANPNAQNGNGSTASMGAAFFGRPDCLEVLLDAGADPSIADENGTTTVTALFVPWEITKAIADAVMIPLDKNTLDDGRKQCGQILESR